MRALYQRKASRDLFDLPIALPSGKADPERVVKCFLRYKRLHGSAGCAIRPDDAALQFVNPSVSVDEPRDRRLIAESSLFAPVETPQLILDPARRDAWRGRRARK
jgi:hypothetical protein